MTTTEWLVQARANADELRDLVGNYHPAMAVSAQHEMEITAPNAELACELVRDHIRAQEPQNPGRRLDAALATGDISEIISVLNGAWFGVPESTSCWRVRGFKEAVDLLDDPPEEA
jgi:hypothetical protein